MSPILILAALIFSIDFLIYALFRWTYPERRANPRPAKSSNRVLAGHQLI
jgi:hypothetical protein